MKIVFIVFGLLALVGQFFTEKKYLGRFLLVLSIISFSGLAYQSWKDLDDIKNYTEAATLNFSGYAGNHGTHISTTLSKQISTIAYLGADKKIHFDCGTTSFATRYEVKKEYPFYPFTYFREAACLQYKDLATWRDEAKQAISIFEITTSIGNHNTDQDAALRALREELRIPDHSALQSNIIDRFSTYLSKN